MSSTNPVECLVGDEALARGAWEEARAAYLSVPQANEIPELLEGLGKAAWWLDLADLVFDARERAYRLFLARDRRRDAARIAVWLAWDYWAFRGENAVANGWLRRARRLLEGEPSCYERAWLEIRSGSLYLFDEGDPERAHRLATEGIRIAQEVGSIDLEMLGRAVQGLALVVSGAIAEGMAHLDEVNASVIAGELTDLIAIGLSCCYLIAACERVRDYDRVAQWCTRLKAFCARWGLKPLFAVCRTQYASICMWRGMWAEAEQELCAASEELASSRPGMTGDAVVRLAELRRRQGRLVEAASLFDEAHAHSLAWLGRAELAFDRGDYRTASEQAERYLRQTPRQNRTDRAVALDLLVRAFSCLGDLEQAGAALAELSTIVVLAATIALRATVSFASGYFALAESKPDTGRRHLKDAMDLFLQSGAPFEASRARLELARALAMLGRIEAATNETQKAIRIFSELHADAETARAQSFLKSLTYQPNDGPAASPTLGNARLTRREIEVLRLVAEGLSNQAISKSLYISDHTVHRHLANILNKLSVSTRAAAVAQASRHGLFG